MRFREEAERVGGCSGNLVYGNLQALIEGWTKSPDATVAEMKRAAEACVARPSSGWDAQLALGGLFNRFSCCLRGAGNVLGVIDV